MVAPIYLVEVCILYLRPYGPQFPDQKLFSLQLPREPIEAHLSYLDSNCGILLSLLLKLLLIKDPYIHKLSILIIVKVINLHLNISSSNLL